MMATIPGIVAVHAIVTPNCRRVDRGTDDPALAAFEEAVNRLRQEYMATLRYRGAADEWNAHLVFTVDSGNRIPA